MTGVVAALAGALGGLPLTATLPATVGGAGPAGLVQTGFFGPTVSGGTPPYTYVWTRLSAPGSPALNISSTTAASVRWSATGIAGNTSTETWRCIVTDALARTATPSTVVTLDWF